MALIESCVQYVKISKKRIVQLSLFVLITSFMPSPTILFSSIKRFSPRGVVLLSPVCVGSARCHVFSEELPHLVLEHPSFLGYLNTV